MSDDQKVRHKRPIWIWLISLFFFLSAIWTLLSFYLIWSGSFPLEPAQKAYFARLTLIDYALSIIGGLLNMSAAVALFLLRRSARDLFLSALGLNFVVVAWQMAARGLGEALGGSVPVGVLMGYFILIAVCIYTWRLSKKGVLH